MNCTDRFDGKGEIYAKARPKYAAGLFDYLKNTLGIPAGSVFADIGSLFLGFFDMRKKAEEKLSDNKSFISVNGSSSDTTLPDGSVDNITADQAFHWFDPVSFAAECKRILKPGGRVIIVYNSRDEKAA